MIIYIEHSYYLLYNKCIKIQNCINSNIIIYYTQCKYKNRLFNINKLYKNNIFIQLYYYLWLSSSCTVSYVIGAGNWYVYVNYITESVIHTATAPS